MLKVRLSVIEVDRYADLRVGILEEPDYSKQKYSETWEASALKKLESEGYINFGGTLCLPGDTYDKLCNSGRRYAKKHGLTFVCQLL